VSRSSMGERLSYANVMATVAVFIALGGSSYAAVKVTGKHVKNETLTGADVKNNSLSGKDIRADSISSGDTTDLFSGAGRIESYYWPDLKDRDHELAVNRYVSGITGAALIFNCRTTTTGEKPAWFEVQWGDPDDPTSSFTWWYDRAMGTATNDGGDDGADQEFPLGIGDEFHTFYGTADGKTLIVQFHSHIDANGCSFAATSQATTNVDG